MGHIVIRTTPICYLSWQKHNNTYTYLITLIIFCLNCQELTCLVCDTHTTEEMSLQSLHGIDSQIIGALGLDGSSDITQTPLVKCLAVEFFVGCFQTKPCSGTKTAALCPLQVITIPADLKCTNDIERVAEESKKNFPKLDILVNNAGILRSGTIENTVTEDFQSVMEVNLM